MVVAGPAFPAQRRSLLEQTQPHTGSCDGISLRFLLAVFQAKGAPRKSKTLEEDSSLEEDKALLAQNEYEEDSSDEEVGPIASSVFLLCGYELEVLGLQLDSVILKDFSTLVDGMIP